MIYFRQADGTLALTGLSDVADILGDLVKEGALSPSALRLISSPVVPTRLKKQVFNIELNVWIIKQIMDSFLDGVQ